MAKLGQYRLHEQLLGPRILPTPNRPISRHRIPLGTTVRKSLSGHSFPKTGQYRKEITYRLMPGAQLRYRYAVTHIPSSPTYDGIWAVWRSAVAAWQALTPSQKKPYNDRADRLNTMSGYNLYIREYVYENY